MTGLVLAEKVCSRCKEILPLSTFGLDGRTGKPRSCCRPCENEKSRAAQKRRSERLGEAEFKAIRNRDVRRHRERTGDRRNKAIGRARSRAISRLIEAHRAEFDALLHLEKYEAGLM